MTRLRSLWVVLAVFALPIGASAQTQGIPSSTTLRSTAVDGDAVDPFSIPIPFAAEDFSLVWNGAPIPGALAAIEHGSVEWVRIDKGHGYLDVPRLRISLAISEATGGRLLNSGFVQPLAVREGGFVTGEMTIPALSGPKNAVFVEVVHDGKSIAGKLELRFTPRPKIREFGRIYKDVTCSPIGLEVESIAIRDDEWAFIGCNKVEVASATHPTTFLEMVILWDGAGDTIDIGGVPTAPVADNLCLWRLQVAPEPGKIQLRSGEHVVNIEYHIPSHPHPLGVSAGIGAYYDTYTLPPQFKSFSGVEPYLTLYAHYTLGATSRITVFDATPIRQAGYTDVGGYLQQMSTELFDRRAVITLFVGGHVLFFKYRDKLQIRPSAPQGGELQLRNVFAWNKNIRVGALLNPGLAGKYYFNGYLRWGGPKWFFEVNYIAWREHDPEDNAPIDLRSVGLTFGGPLFDAL